MNDFFEKWRKDKRYRTKIKLVGYTIFVIIVAIYAISTKDKTPVDQNNIYESNISNNTGQSIDTIDIPTSYSYKITINIDDETYIYSGKKTQNEEIIKKEINGVITNYRYYNNEYYILTDEIYELTTKDTVYDGINYNYINLANINKYLSKAKKIDNEYFVYLKDVVLGNESSNYFIIQKNNNHIVIDYTPLIKELNYNINRYKVDIIIENNN